ncbi:MAG: hypothetical protein HFJ30_00450 [Clostridia bacterium]|jgi:hypothetical protein|nr:hypothetical protein [Clostridia bacterium]
MNNIFIKIMNLIETETKIPRLEKDIGQWLKENEHNRSVYEIYKIASKARKI